MWRTGAFSQRSVNPDEGLRMESDWTNLHACLRLSLGHVTNTIWQRTGIQNRASHFHEFAPPWRPTIVESATVSCPLWGRREPRRIHIKGRVSSFIFSIRPRALPWLLPSVVSVPYRTRLLQAPVPPPAATTPLLLAMVSPSMLTCFRQHPQTVAPCRRRLSAVSALHHTSHAPLI